MAEKKRRRCIIYPADCRHFTSRVLSRRCCCCCVAACCCSDKSPAAFQTHRDGFITAQRLCFPTVLPAQVGLQREEEASLRPLLAVLSSTKVSSSSHAAAGRRDVSKAPAKTMRGRRGSFLAADEGWEAESGSAAAAWRRGRRSGIRSRPRLKALWSCLPSYRERTVRDQQGAIERKKVC